MKLSRTIFLGGTGLWPVVSGVAPETVARYKYALGLARLKMGQRADEIRRDAGFDGRDARATISKHAWKLPRHKVPVLQLRPPTNGRFSE